MKITLTQNKKAKPDFTKLGFGKYFTDHMLIMDYADGEWREPEIVPSLLILPLAYFTTVKVFLKD